FEDMIDFRLLCRHMSRQGVSIVTLSQLDVWTAGNYSGLARAGRLRYPYKSFSNDEGIAYLKGPARVIDAGFPGNGEPNLPFTMMANDYLYVMLHALNPHRKLQPILKRFV